MKVNGPSAIIFLLLIPDISTFEWTSDLQDGAFVYSCIDERVVFPWSFILDTEELLEDIKWYYHYGNGSRESIAATVEDHFFPMSATFSARIEQAGKAGLSVRSLTGLDSGEYSVTVTVHQGSCFTTYNQTVSLIVAEDPLVEQNEALWARQEEVAVYDNETGQVHVQVSCGNYVITERTPVSVEWTLPSGEKRLVSTHTSGTFFLTLSNPVKPGNYTCGLSSKLPPVSCLPQNASVLRSSSVFVDEVKTRLSLLEAEQEILKTEKRALQTEVERLRETAGSHQDQLENHTSSLQQIHDYFEKLESRKVKFEVRRDFQQYYQPYDNVIINNGNAYSVQDKAFIAPFSGTYVLTITCSSYQSSQSTPTASLCDGANCFCHVNPRGEQNARTCQTVVYRSQGQKVQASSDRCDISFSGFSLLPDVRKNV